MRKGFIQIFVLFFISFLACNVFPSPNAQPISIRWLGQACFLIDVPQNHYRILLDPYGPQVGYPVNPQKADVVFISHEHFDHNNISMASGAKVIRGLSSGAKDWALIDETLAANISLRTVGVYHDQVHGDERGLNSVAVLDIHGLRVVHLGDLGHLLNDEQIRNIGSVDVLMLPVGGFFTIDGKEAQKVVAQLQPRLVIPMHYKTKYTSPKLPIQSADSFLEGSPWPVHKTQTDTLVITANRLPSATEVYVLEPLQH